MFVNTMFSAFFQSHDSHDLFEKVRIANDLAKMSSGKMRDSLYEQKVQLLCQAIEQTPNNFAFTYYDERGLIGLRYMPTGDGFHLPAAKLTPGARTAVVQSLTRFLS